MAEELRFDGRVAIVTGAGNGLGRAHALLLARRGCAVVVNDLGGTAHGAGQSTSAADRVVDEIRSAGGKAAANYDSVENGEQIVKTALDQFGRIDIVVNNAGILRDASFQKMSNEDWDLVYRVHLLGSYRVSHAAWNHMRDAGYGRIVFTSSAAGIYGNFGQANYGAMKLGVLGLSNTLAVEGRKKNIRVNTIAPIAGSRLTETVLPKDLVDALNPEFVSPLVAWLCHERCDDTGSLFEVGGGLVTRLRWQRTEGTTFKLGREITPESIERQWNTISDFGKATSPADIAESMQQVIANLSSKSKGGNEFIDVDQALGYELPPLTSHYDERDLANYALSIGAASDPLDNSDLQFVYDLHAHGFRPFPTFAVVPAINAIMELGKQGKQAPGMNYGFERILHGEQFTEIKGPLPPHATLTHKSRIKDIFDKGKHAAVITETVSYDESGRERIRNEFTAIIRGAGGWGGDRGPSNDANAPPERAPDAIISEQTHPNQALMYRLNGDWNPLHADPDFASNFGFSRPILHGLCTFGYAARHVVRSFCGNDPRRFKNIRARFAESVFPGETVVTEMWKESEGRIVFRCRVKERDKVVISHASVELYDHVPTDALAATVLEPAKTTSASEALSAEVFVAIRDHIERHPELVAKTATVFQFKLTSPSSAWVIDLKNGSGSVTSGAIENPDVTLELSDQDFMAMTDGSADPQKLYFGGKLKITGNLMASQKLSFLKKIDPAAAKAAVLKSRTEGSTPSTQSVASVTTRKPVADEVFSALADRLRKQGTASENSDLTIAFKIREPSDGWIVDFKSTPPSVRRGETPSGSTVVTMNDEDLAAINKGAGVKDLFQRGAVRIDGDMRVAGALGFLKS